ncbi:MAG: DUF4080 domain-containing protein [Candidatus Cloacimonetes bacterium]|nr:DUF4080 domain-containing protein [Candidatus Cloacimonadota bacterium]
MKKILFFALNSSWSQSNLALKYMRQMVSGMDYTLIEHSATLSEPLTHVLADVYALKPEVICLSAYIWNRLSLQRIASELGKVLPETLFVVGGPEAYAFEGMQSCLVIKGAGEAAFHALAETGFDPSFDVSIIAHLPLSDIPFPYNEADLAELEDHLVYYECYRGCPYHCVYCLSASDERKELRFDLNKPEEKERLIAELNALSALKPRTLKFIDRSFNIHKDLAHLIWDYAIKSHAKHDFHFEIYPDLLSDEDIALLSKAPENRIRFEIGIQSVNEDVLLRSGRKSDWQKSRHYLNRLREETKVRIHADLLVGLPGGDFQSVIHSLNELCKTRPAAVQLGMLKVLPDTPMLEIAHARGYQWLDDPPYQILKSDALSYDEICYLDDLAHLLSLYWNKEEFAELWDELLDEFSAREILETLMQLHQEQKQPYHSISRLHREQNMQEAKARLRASIKTSNFLVD